MSLLIVLGALVFLMLVAYRGYSVILFAPVAALGAVLLTDPALVAPMFSSVFMEKTVGFLKNYFPVFMLGAVFGKVIELSGFSKSIVAAVIGVLGRERAVLSIVVVCAILTYGGVSLFVVVFAVYPFAAEMFRQSGIPKRLMPVHDCSRRIHLHHGFAARVTADPEHHSHDIFQNDDLGRPVARRDRRPVHSYHRPCLHRESASRRAGARGEGYGTELRNEPEPFEAEKLPNPWIALLAAGGGGRCELCADVCCAARLWDHA